MYSDSSERKTAVNGNKASIEGTTAISMLGYFQANVVKEISSGSLEQVRKLVIGKDDINKPVFLFFNSSFYQQQ